MSLLKIICVGAQTRSAACGPGSSSLLQRWCTGEFVQDTESTTGVEFMVASHEGNKLQLWDATSQPQFRPIVSGYLRGANCICMLVDLSLPDGHEAVPIIFKELGVESVMNEKKNLVLIGTKADAAVGDNAAACREFAQIQGIPFVTVSSKTGAGVADALSAVVRTAIERSDPTPLPPSNPEDAKE